MTNKKKPLKTEDRPLTAADVGRYLKRMSTLQKDAHTGNRALSNALHELAMFLTASKAKTVDQALQGTEKQVELDLPVELETLDQDSTLAEISMFLERKEITMAQLVKLGKLRFGIPESKLKKLSREAVVKTIRSALEHEQSIEILSDEASKGGRNRTS
jgi:TPP-dependent 2-oxoacid decarboxylase